MTLRVNQLIGFGSGGGVKVAVVEQLQVVTAATVLDIGGVNFGPPHPDRTIVVSVSSFDPTTNNRFWDETNAQIGGSAATTLVEQNVDGDDQIVTAIMARAVPTGTSGVVRLAYGGGTVSGHDIVVYRVIGLSSLTATGTGTDSGNPDTVANLDLNTGTNGVLFASCAFYTTSTSVTWSGANESRGYDNGVVYASHAWAYTSAAETPRTVTGTADSALMAGCSASLTF